MTKATQRKKYIYRSKLLFIRSHDIKRGSQKQRKTLTCGIKPPVKADRPHLSFHNKYSDF